MANLTFKSGDVQSDDYTPSSDVAAGEVIVLGNIPYVAHVAIPANTLGALAARGGVYEGISDGSIDTPGAPVYWDDAEGEFVATGSSLTHFGFSVADSAAVDDQGVIRVRHAPTLAPTGA